MRCKPHKIGFRAPGQPIMHGEFSGYTNTQADHLRLLVYQKARKEFHSDRHDREKRRRYQAIQDDLIERKYVVSGSGCINARGLQLLERMRHDAMIKQDAILKGKAVEARL